MGRHLEPLGLRERVAHRQGGPDEVRRQLGRSRSSRRRLRGLVRDLHLLVRDLQLAGASFRCPHLELMPQYWRQLGEPLLRALVAAATAPERSRRTLERRLALVD